jgi:hypothetical protein
MQVLLVVLGGVLSIIGGFFAAWYQTNRADKVAREIRRQERQEQAVLELNAKVAQTHSRLDALYRQVEAGQTQWQYQESVNVMGQLAEAWDMRAGVIRDHEVVDAYAAVAGSVQIGLPSGSAYAPTMATLQSGDVEAGRKFARDLSRVLADLGGFKKVVQRKVADL